MKERHWTSLAASVRHRRSVLVLGPEIPALVTSGASEGEVMMNITEALTAELAAELEDDGRRVTGDTLAAVAQQYEDAEGFGANALRALAEKFYRSPRFAPSPIHSDVASLPFSLILTTTQDDLITRALRNAGKTPIVHRYNLRGDKRDNAEILTRYSSQAPLVFRLFGDAQEPVSLVLSENDLLDFLIAIVSERPPLPNSLVRALRRDSQNFLFIGFGIKNWYLRVLLKVLVRALDLSHTAASIATEPLRGLTEKDLEQTVLFYQRGIRIEVEDADVAAFLAELSRRVDAEGGVTDEVLSAGPQPRVFVSYAREDRDLALRVFDILQRSGFDPWFDETSLSGGDRWDDRIEEALAATDFTLILYTEALCTKTDSYVNKEINLARERALKVRGPFVIPLRAADLPAEQRIAELAAYHDMVLRSADFDEDMLKVMSMMRREYQRRLR